MKHSRQLVIYHCPLNHMPVQTRGINLERTNVHLTTNEKCAKRDLRQERKERQERLEYIKKFLSNLLRLRQKPPSLPSPYQPWTSLKEPAMLSRQPFGLPSPPEDRRLSPYRGCRRGIWAILMSLFIWLFWPSQLMWDGWDSVSYQSI